MVSDTPISAIKLFISYSHEDQALRKLLENHLSTLKRNNVIATWYDGMISAGEEWEKTIHEELESAQIILLLVTSAFIASDFCYSVEMIRAMERHENNSAVVIPIILRPVDWEATPFGKLQALPAGGKPVTKWKPRDEAFRDIAKGILEVVENIKKKNSLVSDYTKNEYSLSEAIQNRFVGRREALDEFYQRFAYIHMQNGVYFYGTGGVGKTWILQKIYNQNVNDPTREVTRIIDFFDTRNQSIRGVQASIIKRLMQRENVDLFEPYNAIIKKIDANRTNKQAVQSGLLAGLENRANQVFINSCQNIVRDRKVILLFDTFEKVQKRDVGQWILQEFLPKVTGVIIVLAGRSDVSMDMPSGGIPDNIVSHRISGLKLHEVHGYIRQNWNELEIPDQVITNIHNIIDGNPLLLDLILDFAFDELIKNVDKFSEVQTVNELKYELINQFRNPNDINRVIWAMAYLKRRFDIPMLKFIVDSHELLELKSTQFYDLIKELRTFKFIKEYPEQESQLLHDEMQSMLTQYFLEVEDHQWKTRGKLFELVVQNYYPLIIKDAESKGDYVLSKQLRAEQFGYVLERSLLGNNINEGLRDYKINRDNIEIDHDYDFEELLWGEIRNQLIFNYETAYEVFNERSLWLRRQSLFSKSEDHLNQMLIHFPNHQISILKSLGFSQLRQGKVEEAISNFSVGLSLLSDENYSEIADFENLQGQANRYYGRLKNALDHYAQSLRAYEKNNDIAGMARVHSNRSYIYATQGLYESAKQEAQRAIDKITTLDTTEYQVEQLHMYALLNKGTAFRHAGEFDDAAKWYLASFEISKRIGHLDGQCQALENRGINNCLLGKKIRIDGNNLTQASQLQLEALHQIVEALSTLVNSASLNSSFADGLSRLAKVFEEIHNLVELFQNFKKPPVDLSIAIQDLQKAAQAFQPSIEVEYENDLLIRGDFSEKNWLEKSARLFELSYLIADGAEDYHRALDSLMEFARILLLLGELDLVPIVINRTDRMKGYDYQEELFSAVAGITTADLHFENLNLDSALSLYMNSYAMLAKEKGYALHLLKDKQEDLKIRLLKLPTKLRIEWCDKLEDSWSANEVFISKPDMLHMLEDIRLQARMEINNQA